MFKKNPAILVWFAAIMFLGYYSFSLYQLLSKSYYVEEDNLYQVGTFHLLNRAHQQSDYRERSYSRPKLVFQSTNYYTFTIDGNIFRAITNVKKLKDTLMYAGLKYAVYTDKECFDKYQSQKSPSLSVYFKLK